METPSEGKVTKTADALLIESLEQEFELAVANYSLKPYVPGLAEVAAGYRPPYPMTIYNVSGDDTSGVAGLLKPDGEFIPVKKTPKTQKFWEFDETLKYETQQVVVKEEDNVIFLRPRVRGNSWTEGEVLWDGSVAGHIDLDALSGEAGDSDREAVYRRTQSAAVTGEWMTTGELWRALERGTGQTGLTHGKVHELRRAA